MSEAPEVPATPQGDAAVRRRAARRRRFRGLVGLGVVVFGLVVGEVAARLVAPPASSFTGQKLYVLDDELGYRLRPNLHQVLPSGVETRINSHGLRDVERPWEKPAGVRRVLVLGDSFTFTSGPVEDGFCAALQRLLGPGVDVINAGVPGWSTTQEATYLARDGLRYDPDVIVVAAFVGNDIQENLGHDRFQVVDNELVAKQADEDEGRSWRKRIMAHSRLYLLVRGVPERIFYGLLGDSVEARRYHKIERRRMGVCSREQTASWEPAWTTTREQLARVKELAGPRPVVLFVIPDEFQVDPALRGAVLERYDLDPAGYDWELPQRRLASWADELGLERVDVLEAMRAAGETLYLPFDSHWNARGNQVGAEHLAQSPALAALRAKQGKE